MARWLKRGAAAVAILLVLLIVGVYGVSGAKLGRDYSAVAGHSLDLPTDSAELAEGRRLLDVYHCTGCHGTDLGGRVMIDDAVFGFIASSNLTAGEGGVAATYSPADWERAIRHGVSPEGRGLTIMPSADYGGISNADLGRMVAWLRRAPPVDRVRGEMRLGPAARAFLAAGIFALSPEFDGHHPGERVDAPARRPTAEYGRYLAQGCRGCHGQELVGGIEIEPGTPPSANLTPHADGLADWSYDDFARAMRTGERPDGQILSEMMPWPLFRAFEDDELQALWAHLQTVAPQPDATN